MPYGFNNDKSKYQLPDMTAENVVYDNTSSALVATNVNDAIDEVHSQRPVVSQSRLSTTLFNDDIQVIKYGKVVIISVFNSTKKSVARWTDIEIADLPYQADTENQVGLIWGQGTNRNFPFWVSSENPGKLMFSCKGEAINSGEWMMGQLVYICTE